MDIAPTYPIYNQGCGPHLRFVGWATKHVREPPYISYMTLHLLLISFRIFRPVTIGPTIQGRHGQMRVGPGLGRENWRLSREQRGKVMEDGWIKEPTDWIKRIQQIYFERFCSQKQGLTSKVGTLISRSRDFDFETHHSDIWYLELLQRSVKILRDLLIFRIHSIL